MLYFTLSQLYITELYMTLIHRCTLQSCILHCHRSVHYPDTNMYITELYMTLIHRCTKKWYITELNCILHWHRVVHYTITELFFILYIQSYIYWWLDKIKIHKNSMFNSNMYHFFAGPSPSPHVFNTYFIFFFKEFIAAVSHDQDF